MQVYEREAGNRTDSWTVKDNLKGQVRAGSEVFFSLFVALGGILGTSLRGINLYKLKQRIEIELLCVLWRKWEFVTGLARADGMHRTKLCFPFSPPPLSLPHQVPFFPALTLSIFMLVTVCTKLNKIRTLPASPGTSALSNLISLSRWLVVQAMTSALSKLWFLHFFYSDNSKSLSQQSPTR